MGAALKTHLLSATARALGVLVIAGCSAGGPSAPPSPTPPQPTTNPTIQVLPATYDFGKVTPGNVCAPLEVTIRNGGDGTLSVSNIARTPADPTFAVRPDGGSKPCNSTTPTLAPGDACTFHVAFQSASTGSFATNIQISSNDRATPVFGVPVSAALEPVSLLTVRINQLQTACPANEVTAYVSVTDQGGYPVTGLLSTNFSIVQEATQRPIVSLSYVDLAYKPIAIGGGLDFSSSLTSQPIAFADMKKGFTDLFNNLKATDLGEVVKFGAVVELTQGFTSDKARLAGAVAAPFDNRRGNEAVRRRASIGRRHCCEHDPTESDDPGDRRRGQRVDQDHERSDRQREEQRRADLHDRPRKLDQQGRAEPDGNRDRWHLLRGEYFAELGNDLPAAVVDPLREAVHTEIRSTRQRGWNPFERSHWGHKRARHQRDCRGANPLVQLM